MEKGIYTLKITLFPGEFALTTRKREDPVHDFFCHNVRGTGRAPPLLDLGPGKDPPPQSPRRLSRQGDRAGTGKVMAPGQGTLPGVAASPFRRGDGARRTGPRRALQRGGGEEPARRADAPSTSGGAPWRRLRRPTLRPRHPPRGPGTFPQRRPAEWSGRERLHHGRRAPVTQGGERLFRGGASPLSGFCGAITRGRGKAQHLRGVEATGRWKTGARKGYGWRARWFVF
ncbi:hypothetical protein GWK47_029514 [Chionoecetes opilio]|uniref:Uncharacterized protein n=1 Tax=Chionoecetes opilio TaxID=41210 RepID=A0A8J4YSE7_CHIOP|nr:hypothetical protein GWK47_029514 [Chionoecetes opilio]